MGVVCSSETVALFVRTAPIMKSPPTRRALPWPFWALTNCREADDAASSRAVGDLNRFRETRDLEDVLDGECRLLPTSARRRRGRDLQVAGFDTDGPRDQAEEKLVGPAPRAASPRHGAGVRAQSLESIAFHAGCLTIASITTLRWSRRRAAATSPPPEKGT